METARTHAFRAAALCVVFAVGCSGSSPGETCSTCGSADSGTSSGDASGSAETSSSHDEGGGIRADGSAGGDGASDSAVDADDGGARPDCAPAAEELPEPTNLTYDPNATLQKIVISGPASAYAIGPTGEANFQLEDQGIYSDGTIRLIESRAEEQVPDDVRWTSSDTSIATVSSGDSLISGSIQGLRPGMVTITVTEGSVSASVCFTITPAVVQTLTITDARPDAFATSSYAVAKPGDTVPFVCTETLTDGTSVVATQSVTWTSSSPSVASISSPGSVQSLVAGTTTITATLPASVARARNAPGTGSLTLDVIGTGGGLAEGASCAGTTDTCAAGLSCCSLGRLSPTVCAPSPCPPPTPSAPTTPPSG